MLAPDSRVVLLEQLAPPPGSRFDAAAATTFTLDLTATLIPALAFTSYSYSGSSADPIALLEAIRATGDRLDVFCQGGNIAAPSHVPDLLAFLEPLVHEVKRPRGGLFHPKIWFVRYVDDAGKASYRLFVLTRNLSNDRSWDLAVRLDSASLSDEEHEANAPLADLLASLPARTIRELAPERVERINQLAGEARRIEWQWPDTVRHLGFHFLDWDRPMPDLPPGRRLVVSPFINDAGLALLDPRGATTVLSRAVELEKLSPEVAERLDAYVIDSMAVVTETDETNLGGDLHAKMFVVEPTAKWASAHVFIGSANATDAAFQRNVEFMVELHGHRDHLGIDAFLGDTAPFRVLLEPYRATGGAAPDPDEDERRQVESALREIAEIEHQVAVIDRKGEASAATGLEVRVSARKPYPLRAGWQVSVRLMTKAGNSIVAAEGEALDGTFSGIATADVTPFLVVQITTDSGLDVACVIAAELINPPDDRLDHILARQIDTPDKFLRFLYLLLSLGNPHLLAQLAGSAGGDGSGFGIAQSGGPGILELVLRALSERPAALGDLDRLVQRLQSTEQGREVLPGGFDAFWATVREAQQLLGGARA